MARRRRRYGYDDFGYGYFPPSKPRKATGGIKAQSKRGSFGTSWWAKRWIEVLESFDIGARLGRGRSYARKGQVLSVDVGKGTVAASVQGSRSTPYKVRIEVKTLSKPDWKRLAEAFSAQAVFAAKLLAGEMPQDVETAFEGVGLSLFPAKHRDLRTDCSCPDWSNPCKHIAAVYYLLGEEFDRDPFLIFRLRGMERDELVKLIGSEPGAAKKAGGKRQVAPPEEETEEAPPAAEPLPSDPGAFWDAATTAQSALGEVRVPPVSAALPKRLGAFPFWRAEANFLDAMDEIYRAASPVGMDVFLGEREAVEKEAEAPRRRSARSGSPEARR
ncbi:MAG TPA: SWIM zinc finger family protein [Thermoguttaceae bacterium]|nr:SWIM zinc finger family protein [Thermoguttaceae bacterium]